MNSQSQWEEHVRLLENMPKDELNRPYSKWKGKDVFEKLQEEIPPLKQWCEEYLEANRAKLRISFWLEHGWVVTKRSMANREFLFEASLLHRSFKQEWNEILEELGNPPEASFQNAVEAIGEAYEIHDIACCNVKEILDKHEGKPCISNGWYCDYCEDQEYAWRDLLKKRLEASGNVFLNKEAKEIFLKRAVEAISNHSTWEPPASNPQIQRDTYATELKRAKEFVDYMIDFAKWRRNLFSHEGNPFHMFVHTWCFVKQFESLIGVLQGLIT